MELSETTFTVTPQGPFSLDASIRFLEGFVPAGSTRSAIGGLDLAFTVDGHWDTVAVHVDQSENDMVATLSAPSGTTAEVIAAAQQQVVRIFSLDVDGSGFAAVGQADPVVAGLQDRYPGLRPVCFWSPYEAAAWAIIGQRIRMVQAAKVKARMTEALGTTLTIDGREVTAFPPPEVLADVDAFPGLNDVKIARLGAVAEAALDGTLDAARLRSMPRTDALDQLKTIAGIGPFSSELILLRGAGDPDWAPTEEERLRRAVGMAYAMDATPTAAEVADRSQAWRPYRTWVSLLLRTMLEDETHEISGQRRPKS